AHAQLCPSGYGTFLPCPPRGHFYRSRRYLNCLDRHTRDLAARGDPRVLRAREVQRARGSANDTPEWRSWRRNVGDFAGSDSEVNNERRTNVTDIQQAYGVDASIFSTMLSIREALGFIALQASQRESRPRSAWLGSRP